MKTSEIVFDKTISNRYKFGVYIKSRRCELGISLKDFAKSINLTSAYIVDIEKGNRYAPLNHLNRIATVLQINQEELNYFYDIAGSSHSNWPDINEYLEQTPNARKAIRLAKHENLSEQEFLEAFSKMQRERIAKQNTGDSETEERTL